MMAASPAGPHVQDAHGTLFDACHPPRRSQHSMIGMPFTRTERNGPPHREKRQPLERYTLHTAERVVPQTLIGRGKICCPSSRITQMKTVLVVSRITCLLVLAGMSPGCSSSHTVHVRALKTGDIEQVKRLFVTKADASMQLEIGSHRRFFAMPLHIAVSSGNLEVVDHLLTLGASPNDTDYRDWTAFFYISESSEEKAREMIKALQDAGGNIEQPETAYALTPLINGRVACLVCHAHLGHADAGTRPPSPTSRKPSFDKTAGGLPCVPCP
jgi:hypothetical protein